MPRETVHPVIDQPIDADSDPGQPGIANQGRHGGVSTRPRRARVKPHLRTCTLEGVAPEAVAASLREAGDALAILHVTYLLTLTDMDTPATGFLLV